MLRPTKAHNEHSPLTLLKLESGGYYTLLELTLTIDAYELSVSGKRKEPVIGLITGS